MNDILKMLLPLLNVSAPILRHHKGSHSELPEDVVGSAPKHVGAAITF
jgi:hypothetical protein